MAKLTDAQVADALAMLPGWSRLSDEITKTFKFAAYADNLAFVAAVGRISDRRDHHPDLLVTYPSVQVTLSTHSDGGITEKDTELAGAIESVSQALMD